MLTEAGQRALVYAEDIFSKGEELEFLLRNGIDNVLKTLKIGVLSTMSRNLVESFINPLIRPASKFAADSASNSPSKNRDEDSQSLLSSRYSLHARRQASLLDGLYSHQFDVGLTHVEVMGGEQDLLQCQLLARQPVSIIGPTGLQFDKEMFYQQVQTHDWVLPAGDSPVRSAFDSFCGQHQIRPNIVAEADDMAMLRLLARDSGALAVLPNVVVKDELASKRLTIYLELPNIYENFYAVTIKRQYSHPLVNKLLAVYLDG